LNLSHTAGRFASDPLVARASAGEAEELRAIARLAETR
jgi:hypothetical protein